MKKTLFVLALAAAGAYFWTQSQRQAALPFVSHNNAPPSSAATTYVNGTYTGPVANAYYGNMQIQAIVSGGKLSAVKVLQYPDTHGASISINSQALPMLRNEVIAAQSANVNIISGATLSSEAFIRSLSGALSKAG
jgi:uncharacterized protein with FMN-binding domain